MFHGSQLIPCYTTKTGEKSTSSASAYASLYCFSHLISSAFFYILSKGA